MLQHTYKCLPLLEKQSPRRVASPVASPIHRPLSSTPYQGRQSSSGGNLNGTVVVLLNVIALPCFHGFCGV